MTGLGFAFFHWHKFAMSDQGFCYRSDVKQFLNRHWHSSCGEKFRGLQQ